MSVEALRQEVTARGCDFAWDQWTQMGVSGPSPGPREQRAADPEALLLFTLEIGRHDPRLFDEVLDWLALNEQLVSVQRLRNLCRDEVDRALVDAALSWVGQRRPRTRLASRQKTVTPPRDRAPLFVGLSTPETHVDSTFARHGFLRAHAEPSGKSQPPDLSAPINFGFRLRRLLGVGARAEVTRALLTIDAPRVSSGALHASAGFTRPNVRESLLALEDAGVARSSQVGGDRLYSMHHAGWAQLLGLGDGLPRHHDWIQILGTLRVVARWLHAPDTDGLSEYMLSSDARALITRLEPELRFAGVAVSGQASMGETYWPEFAATVERLLESL